MAKSSPLRPRIRPRMAHRWQSTQGSTRAMLGTATVNGVFPNPQHHHRNWMIHIQHRPRHQMDPKTMILAMKPQWHTSRWHNRPRLAAFECSSRPTTRLRLAHRRRDRRQLILAPLHLAALLRCLINHLHHSLAERARESLEPLLPRLVSEDAPLATSKVRPMFGHHLLADLVSKGRSLTTSSPYD